MYASEATAELDGHHRKESKALFALTDTRVAPMAVESSQATAGVKRDGAAEKTPGRAELMHVVGRRLADTAAHGIPNISRANTKARQVAWTALFLAGFGMFIYQGCWLVITYYSYPINVNIEVRSQKRTEFPAVTWCNLNPIVTKSLLDYRELNALIGNDAGDRPTSAENDRYDATDEGENEDPFYEIMNQVIQIVGQLPYPERPKTGHQIDDMLLKCTFQSKSCSKKNFTQFYNARYGNCYTFNSGVNGQAPFSVTKTGPSYGLSMELYIEQDQYNANVETGAGVRIMVHNQTGMPFPEDEGANVAPGRETFIGLSRVLVSRLPSPYGTCIEDFPIESNIFKKTFGHLNYTLEACQKHCYAQEVVNKCNCSDAKYRYENSQKVCNMTDEDTDKCVDGIQDSFTEGRLDCGRCQMSCSEMRYVMSYSDSMWPNREYKEIVQQKLREYKEGTVDLMRNNSLFIEENVLRINIFYQRLDYDDIYQSAAYTSSNLVSDLGGQVGLWIGVSVLTLFELVELVYDIILMICGKQTF